MCWFSFQPSIVDGNGTKPLKLGVQVTAHSFLTKHVWSTSGNATTLRTTVVFCLFRQTKSARQQWFAFRLILNVLLDSFENGLQIIRFIAQGYSFLCFPSSLSPAWQLTTSSLTSCLAYVQQDTLKFGFDLSSTGYSQNPSFSLSIILPLKCSINAANTFSNENVFTVQKKAPKNDLEKLKLFYILPSCEWKLFLQFVQLIIL